jgi:peptide/nickel transport system substrate-binding protein
MSRTGRSRLPAALLLVAALGGCGKGAGREGGTIVRRLEGEPKTLNALLATSDPDLTVLALVSRNLLDYDASLSLVPGLAESVVPDAERKSFTVTLRPDAVWEDGTRVTADDVVYTVETLVDPKTPSVNRRGFFEGFVKAQRVDDRTARVSFAAASSNRLDAFNLPLLPAARYRGGPIENNPLDRAPLANGPYRVAKWTAGSSLELERNPRAFGPPGGAERLVFRIVPESAAAFEALKTGALDDARLTQPQYAELERANGKAGTLLWNDLSYTYIGWNNRLPLFEDARVRRALTQMIDREGISRALYGGLARPANGPLPPGLWPHDRSLAPIPFDPASAAALLDEAGFRRGKDGVREKGGRRFAFALSFGAGSDVQRQIAETIQQAFRVAGIQMTIQPMEWSAFSTAVDEGRFEACFLAMNLDPNPDLFPNWHSSQTPPTGWNSVFYKNPRVDLLVERLRDTFDRAAAMPLYAEAQRLIRDDEPVTFLHFVPVKWGIGRRIEGAATSPIGLSLFWPGAASWRTVRAKSPA